MEVKIKNLIPWSVALDEARRTVGKESLGKEPSSKWKLRSLIAEHSQVKLVTYMISFSALRQWVGVHLLRHEHTLPFIHSQREDRRELGCSRDELPQGSLNDQDFVVNAQTLINMGRKRLCYKASKETREAFSEVKKQLSLVDPELASVIVQNCIYRGFCPEMESCGFCNTDAFKKQREEYVLLNQ